MVKSPLLDLVFWLIVPRLQALQLVVIRVEELLRCFCYSKRCSVVLCVRVLGELGLSCATLGERRHLSTRNGKSESHAWIIASRLLAGSLHGWQGLHQLHQVRQAQRGPQDLKNEFQPCQNQQGWNVSDRTK